MLRGLAWALALQSAVLGLLRFVPVPTSAFMLRDRIERIAEGRPAPLAHRWVPWRELSPWLGVAVVAAEDQRFPVHHGFDFDAIADALEEHRDGDPLRGASTISQQVAKNLFLWPGRSVVRKSLEAWLTLWIELLWSKRRILEVYLNVAEFGDGVYGVGAACPAFFGTPPARIGPSRAALLAAVLPSPRRLDARAPSPYLRERARTIEREMARIGGVGVLSQL